MNPEELQNTIISCALEVYHTLGYGYLEKVYENALIYELENHGLKTENQKFLDVYYKDIIVGTYKPDIIVEDSIILELKAKDFINPRESAQLVNYLTATKIDYGIIINFGNSEKLIYFKKTRLYQKK